MSAHDMPPLPEKIAEEMHALRQVEPSRDLVDRAFAGLADLPKQAKPQSKGSTWKNHVKGQSMWFQMMPVAALAAAALAIVIGRQSAPHAEDVVRFEERELSLPESGHAWTALDLQTHHHDGHPTVVHLEVPTHVRVSLPSASAANGDQGEQHCTEARCVHRFTQHHGKGVPVRIAVTHPGRYEIHVRHESKKAAMREHFVVTASRD